MGKYSPTPIRYSGQLKSMEDVYRKYRNSISHKEEYKSHESKISYAGFQRGFQKTEYLREQQQASERKNIEQQHMPTIKLETKIETQNDIQPELKTTTQDNELQNQKQSEIVKLERAEQKKELEKQDDGFYNDNSLTKYENDVERQSDTMSHRRPSPYDKELRW